MAKIFLSALPFGAILIAGLFSPAADAQERPWKATVKVELLPVYAENSVTSGIVKMLKKGEVVEVRTEVVNIEGKWCGIAEYGRKPPLGFVNCESLDFSIPSSSTAGPAEKRASSEPARVEETPRLRRPASPPAPPEPPRLGDFLAAIWKGDVAEVRDFLEKGGDPNASTSYGAKPLLIAAKLKNPEMIKILVEKGADVNGRDQSGMTPLMAAASVGQTRNVRVLLESGADMNAKDHKGLTALIWASAKGFPEVVELLLAKGADVNVRTADGFTALRLSRRIIADLKKSLEDPKKTKDQKALAQLKKDLARHERVLELLERTGKKGED